MYDNARDDDAFLWGRETSDCGREIIQHLENSGIVRPCHAASNSRANESQL